MAANPITDRDERWTFGHALNVENPSVGTFLRSTLHAKIILTETQSNWVLASVPTPNVTKGWRISSVLLRYTIRGRAGHIDKVGLRDGDQLVHSFEGLNVGPAASWQTLTLPLSPARKFRFGLGVSIHVDYPDNFDPQPLGPSEFLFASVGLGFVKQSGIESPTP
jgi:hypothetical protein